MPIESEKAPFKVTSHILEDLGLTLYTSLARVLVEFVANAYDADASYAKIEYDPQAIEKARQIVRNEHEREALENGEAEVEPLDSRTLPEEHAITITDDGHGMTRDQLVEKFLVAGRRRLIEDPHEEGRSPNGRPLMGRKGLGKLAGFGVAKLITVTSRGKGEANATQVILDYDEIHDKKFADDIMVPILELSGGDGLPEDGGTRIRLSRLLHAPTKNRPSTIAKELGDHFALIDSADFAMHLAGDQVVSEGTEHAFAWPEPERPTTELVEATYTTEHGREVSFRYRLRFTQDKKSLRASRRGVRVYTNRRLCAAPSLLDADTNMHGFRMVDYLDGVVHADFIAMEPTDYIATDRQGLRWESPLLQPMHDLLSRKIKEACARYQGTRDIRSRKRIDDDEFTQKHIGDAGLSGRDLTTAKRVASLLCSSCKEGVDGQEYKDKLPALVQGIGHGTVLTEIAKIATEPNPDLERLVAETARLTHDELGRFMSTVRGRLRAIEGLRKIIEAADFKHKENEKEIQSLLEESPWIIDPTFTQFLSADRQKRALFERLAKELGIGSFSNEDPNDKERPDLVFLLGSESLQRLIIIELKSSNTPLMNAHLSQLKRYMDDAETWLREQSIPMNVRGVLIGMRDNVKSTKKGARDLRYEEKNGAGQPWQVRSYSEILEETEAAHKELLAINAEVEAASEDAAGS